MKKQWIISIIIILLVLSVVYFVSKNRIAEEDSAIKINEEEDLLEIANEFSFQEHLYKENSEEYLKEQSKILSLYINDFLEENQTSVQVSSLNSEQILHVTNLLLSGGENICYTEQFIKEKVKQYFNRSISFSTDSIYYTIDEKNICFEPVWINSLKNITVTNYEENNNSVEIEITEIADGDSSLKKIMIFNYKKEGENYYLNYLKFAE